MARDTRKTHLDRRPGSTRPDRRTVRFQGLSPVVFFLPLFVAVALALAWVFLPPEKLDRMLDRRLVHDVDVQYLAVAVEGKTTRMAPGETLAFHPADEFEIIGLETNLRDDSAVRLYCPSLDTGDLSKPTRLDRLLGLEYFQQPRNLEIQAKYGRNILARFHFDVRMTALDWVTRADQAEQAEDRIKYARLALELEPENASMLRILAASLEETEDFSLAAETYTRLQSLEPENEDVRQRRVDAWLMAGEVDKAAAVYEETIKDPPNPATLKKIMGIYREAGDDEKTIAVWKRLIDASPPDEAEKLLRELAGRYLATGEIENALAEYEELIGRLPDEKKIAVLQTVADIHRRSGEYDKAAAEIRRASKINPDDRNLVLDLATLLKSAGDNAGWLEQLARAAELKPDDLGVRITLVDGFVAAGRKDEARAELEKILETFPGRSEVRLRLIDLIQAQGDTAGLIAQYEALLDSAPKNRVLLYNLGVLYYESGNLDRAEEMMKGVVRLDPDDRAAHQYLFDIYQKRKMTPETVDQAQELIRLGVDREEFFNFVHDFFVQGQQWQNLAVAALVWTGIHPEKPHYWAWLAEALEKTNQFKEAAEAYEKQAALLSNEKKLEVLAKAAGLYEKAEAFYRAMDVYDRILTIDPKDKNAANGRVRARVNALKNKKGKTE